MRFSSLWAPDCYYNDGTFYVCLPIINGQAKFDGALYAALLRGVNIRIAERRSISYQRPTPGETYEIFSVCDILREVKHRRTRQLHERRSGFVDGDWRQFQRERCFTLSDIPKLTQTDRRLILSEPVPVVCEHRFNHFTTFPVCLFVSIYSQVYLTIDIDRYTELPNSW